MQTLTLVSFLVLGAILLLAAPKEANAACCPAVAIDGRGRSLVCGDCTTSTPYCGYDRCNIFGCNCECRTGACTQNGKRSVNLGFGSAEGRVAAGDLNGDGVLTLLEAETMLRQEGVHAVNRRSVRSLDANQDGQLTVDEIDAYSSHVANRLAM